MHLAPIIVFGFNRYDAIRNTIESLKSNTEAKDSVLYVFIDGWRDYVPGEEEKVRSVIEYVNEINGFKQIIPEYSNTNKGLAPSLIYGITKVMDIYGSAIIVEDDLIVSKNFLSYMNQALEKYQYDDNVFSVSGFGLKVKPPKLYNSDSYFCTRSWSWGWATWKNRWDVVDWNLDDWDKCISNKNKFNRWGGSDCFGMLDSWKKGRISSWAIRFAYAIFVNNKVALFPIKSKVQNEGFNGEGTNCKKYSRFRIDFDKTENKSFVFPETSKIDRNLLRQFLRYHSIPIRAWSKLMYKIYR